MKYSFSVSKWVLWLLPSVLRMPKTVAWLNSLMSPIAFLHTRFYQFVLKTKAEIRVNGQVSILRGYLNDKFDVDDRRIELIDSEQVGQTFVFLEIENQPLYLPVFLSQGGSFDFVVRVPIGLISKETALKAVLNKYKLPSKSYQIQFF